MKRAHCEHLHRCFFVEAPPDSRSSANTVPPSKSPLISFAPGVLAAAIATVIGGCASVPRIDAVAERYRIELRLDPESHLLQGRATIDMSLPDIDESIRHDTVAVDLRLHSALDITSVEGGGVKVAEHYSLKDGAGDGETLVRKHRVVVSGPERSMTLYVTFQGHLRQDVESGEAAGRIHNEVVKAHIGPEGIFLGDDACWYPQPVWRDGPAPAADFTVLSERITGMELMAGAERDDRASDRSGKQVWRNTYPLGGMVLVGGPHVMHQRRHRSVDLRLHLRPEQERHVDGLFGAISRSLDRYEPLIGPYPASQYAVVDNFFSSGFAFPTFALLGTSVIDMGERAWTTHGYLDHELLHSWWGNGVLVDSRDGNWCEALASYAANYYGYVLDGEEEESRRKRRNYVHFLNRRARELDKPLGTFELKDGCSRSIGYDKGAMVFHMLSRRLGEDTFWRSIRRFSEEHLGRRASWGEIRRSFEIESGKDLEGFFDQWVRRGGAPTVSVARARFDASQYLLTMDLTQSEPAYDLDVPIRIHHAEGAVDVEVRLPGLSRSVTQSLDVMPTGVEVDPDYHVFRMVPAELIVPTTAATRGGKAFACVRPGSDVPAAYIELEGIFASSFPDERRIRLTAGQIGEGALADRSLLILGNSVRDPMVTAFLRAVEFPVRWSDSGFEFDEVRYEEEGHAVLCTIRHPGDPGGGITVVYANGEAAIPRPASVPMYDRSLVIFRDRIPILRSDFESSLIQPVEH